MKYAVIAAACALALGGCQSLHPSVLGKGANPPALSLPDGYDKMTGPELAGALIAASDQRCEDYLIGVSIQRTSGKAGLGALGSALTTVGTVAGSGRAANAFAGAGTWVNSTARSVEEGVFGRSEFAVIYDAVKRGRTVDRNAFFRDMAQFKNLGPHEVLARIRPYDLNCGITYGMVELSRAVQQPSNRQSDLQPGSTSP